MNSKIFLISVVLVSSVAFSNVILTYPSNLSVVRGGNVTFTVYIGGSGRCSVWTSGRYAVKPKSVSLNGAAKFTVVYISTEPSVEDGYLTIYATNSKPVKLRLRVLPNDGDKILINETFADYVKKVKYIKERISNDPNAMANGMVGLTNIVIEKLWVAKGYIDSGKYYEAYQVLSGMRPQMSALENYVGQEKRSYKSYVIIIVGACTLLLMLIVFEVFRHFMLKPS